MTGKIPGKREKLPKGKNEDIEDQLDRMDI